MLSRQPNMGLSLFVGDFFFFFVGGWVGGVVVVVGFGVEVWAVRNVKSFTRVSRSHGARLIPFFSFFFLLPFSALGF